MKTRMFLMLGAVALLAVLPTALQAQEQMLFRVNIPFEFIAGGVHMPAGEYMGFHTTPSLIQVVREDGRASAWIHVKASPVGNGETRNQLVFNRYGDTYFLAKVTTGHDQQEHECFRCRMEQTLAAQYAPAKPETVLVAMH